MNVIIEARFVKDLLHINDDRLLEKIKQLILQCKDTKSQNTINQLKKEKGYDTFYRVRIA